MITAGSLQALAIDPKNPDIAYAVTGDLIYKSSDGAFSWGEIPPFPGYSQVGVSSLAVDPFDSKILYVATSNGILRSVDGGDKFQLVNSDVNSVYTLTMDPMVPDMIYATLSNGFLQSTDGGTSWRPMGSDATADLHFIRDLKINPRDSHLLYAAAEGGVYSYNGNVTPLYLPRLVTRNSSTGNLNDSEYTGVAVVNLDSTDAEISFTAYKSDGTMISGDKITNPALRQVRAGGQISVMDLELWGEGLASAQAQGWFKIESTTRIAGFFLTFNGTLTAIDGADVGTKALSSWVFTEIMPAGSTQVHVANPNAVKASVYIDLIDAGGRVRQTTSRSIEANGGLMEMLSSLFPGADYYPSDYMKFRSDQALIPFELTGKSARAIEGLNGQDSTAGATALYCPQYVVWGTDWSTALSIVNPSAADATVVLRLIGDDGAQIGASRTVTIPRGGKSYIDDQKFFMQDAASPVQGYLEIKSAGALPAPLIGSVSFGDPERNRLGSSLPLVQNLMKEFVFSQVVSNASWWTGITLVNPNDSAASVTMRLFDGNGNAIRSKSLVIPARQRVSKVLVEPEYFGDLAGVEINAGYVHVTVDKGIAAFAAFGTHTLSALAAVPAQGIR